MPQFQPDIVTFNDLPGYGAWDTGHAREHLQFVQVLAQQTPPVLIPNFDLLSFLTAGQARRSMLQSHMNSHALLRQITAVSGIDLAQVNLDDNGDFDNWLGAHQSEHAQIRQALGIV